MGMCLPINPIGTKEPTSQPTDSPTFVSSTTKPTSVSPTSKPTATPTDLSTSSPTTTTLEPTASPAASPSENLTSTPSASPTSSPEPCCSLDFKNCINWCGPTKKSCSNCNHHDGVGWLSNGPPKDKCLPRWKGCENKKNVCCNGLTCKADANNYLMCLPIKPIGTKEPTSQPTDSPTFVSTTLSASTDNNISPST